MVQSAATYELDRQGFRLTVPEYFNFARDVLGHWAEDPAKRALLWVDERGRREDRTFRSFAERSSRLADGLGRLGVKKGDRVLVIIPPEPAWWESFMALLKLGALIAPGTSQLTARDIRYRLQVASISAIMCDEATAARADEALKGSDLLRVVVGRRDGWHTYDEVLSSGSESFAGERTRSDDPAILYFTSGTTGYPKMVLHTHASYPIGHIVTGKFWLDLRPDDLHWNLSDTGWAKAAWSSLFAPWNMGAASFVYRQYGKPDPARILSQFSDHGVTSFCGPPTIFRMLVQADLSTYRYDSLRSCVAAGEPLNPEVIEAWRRATGLTIRDGYGQTETVVLVANFPGVEVRPGSMGKPSPGFIVDVVGDDGHPVPANKEGDIAVRVSPERPVGLFREYWNDPEATQRAFRGDWYITGDRAYRDEDGYLWFVGRADDVIISAAYRIGPFEVESALVEHPAVVEAAVVGKPDPERGEIVKAFLTLAPGYAGSEELTRELQDHVKSVTAPYKYPREVEYVDELPKTVSGKIRRVELRERERSRS
ncbi:MAG: AMP-binding protein [Chloroflexi bacterium]|nr:AMP-binding protein [Chloroflexota bacterium]